MSALEFRSVKGAIHLPALRLGLDAHTPIRGDEAVSVSHAHSDHSVMAGVSLLSASPRTRAAASSSG